MRFKRMGSKTCTVYLLHNALPHVPRVLDSVSSSLKQTQCCGCDLWQCSWSLSAGLLSIRSSYLLAAQTCSPALSPTQAFLWTAPLLPPPVARASACADWTAPAASSFSFWDLNPRQIEALVGRLKSVRSSQSPQCVCGFSSIQKNMQQTLLHSVWHERGYTVWVSVFLFSLLCFAKFNFKSICCVLSSLSLSSSLFSSPSLTLSEMCSSVPRQYFVWVFPPGADPCGALCSENERLWI